MKLHNDIDLLPLALFLRCLCDRDFRCLVLEGNPSDEEVLQAWTELYSQFIDLNSSDASQYVLGLQKDIEVLTYRITTTEGALKLLRIIHDNRIVDVLAGLRYTVKHLVPGLPQYARAIAVIEGNLPVLKNRLQIKERELMTFSEQQEGGEANKESFRTMLAKLSRFMHLRLTETEIMTGEYCRYVREYVAHYSKPKPAEDNG